jgi:hypothetical protein
MILPVGQVRAEAMGPACGGIPCLDGPDLAKVAPELFAPLLCDVLHYLRTAAMMDNPFKSTP